MKYFASALWQILKSWFSIVALVLDLVGGLVAYYSNVRVPAIVYPLILAAGFFLGAIVTMAENLRSMDNWLPFVVSNDNLSLGGQGLSSDSISLRNVGGSAARVTNISSDAQGKVRIIHEHYMESFVLDPSPTPQNIMITEAKIIEGLPVGAARPSSLLNEWHDPFSIYIWYETLEGKHKFCTRVGFQSGNRYIRNLGWKRHRVD